MPQLEFPGEPQYIRAALAAERQDLKTLTKVLQKELKEGATETENPNSEYVEFFIPNDRFVSKNNVYQRICSLDRPPDITVLNMEFSEGGHVDPHSHDRIQTNYVLWGEYTDGVSGETYHRGQVQIIESHQPHSIISDSCLLTVTWVPAYQTINQNTQNTQDCKTTNKKYYWKRFKHKIKSYFSKIV